MDYDLGLEQKRRYHCNFVDGETKTFYRTYARNQCSTFEEACDKVKNEFDSISIQNEIQKYVQSLTFISLLENSLGRITKA